MADFTTTTKALNNGEHVRRSEWGEGSTMYATQDRPTNAELARTEIPMVGCST